jgi:ankyrin repeat protein
VEALLEHGAHIDSETTMKRTPLIMATLQGDFEIVDLLVSCGADVNKYDIDNNTSLHYASRIGRVKIVEYFLYKRADYSLKNIYGETPLDLVGNYEVYSVSYFKL